ncbi:unnamed protein product [Litomosoides sigmodontis]|uniref:Histidine acid phosphatase n=1 Tax=Litomosoides sigmodontis TaxID=42156 RepID=A0A3P6SXN6_LITSI|nr:unnamed protein product [Litomosoides sigmodontis]
MPVCFWYVAVCCIVVRCAHSIRTASIAIDENTKLVIFGMRHGNSHPETFLNENLRSWGFEGFGKREGFGFGKELREFVGPLVGNNYVRHEVAFYTSSANRCQMTLQIVMAGFYPPDTFAEWNHALEWSPVPYTIDDPMLQMYSVPNCSITQQAWEPIVHDNLPKLAQLITSNAQLLKYIALHTGWNESVKSASNLADNILQMNLYNRSLPDWIERPTLGEFDKKSLQEAIMMFQGKHSLTCANYEPCRDAMAGTWLNHILTTLHSTANGQQTEKLIGYVSHLEVVLSVMKLLRTNQSSLDTTAGFLVEYRDKPYKSIRLLFHEALIIDGHVIQQAKYADELEELGDSNHWIPFESFYQLVKDKAISNWEEEACGREAQQCAASGSGNVISSQSTVTDSSNDDSPIDHRTTSTAPPVTSIFLCNILIYLAATLSFLS